MKKFYLLGCAATMVVSGAMSQTTPKPENQAFYLVGSMNGWQTASPSDAETFPFRVADEDGDGVYTASFEITEPYIQFKVFSEPTSWETGTYFGAYGDMYVFSNEPTSTYLYSGSNPPDITVPNWKGGTLEVSITWESVDNEWRPFLKMQGPGQPEKPAAQEIYIIGEFNGWKLPESSNANGAMALKTLDSTSSYYLMTDKLDFAPQTLELAVCTLDKVTGDVRVLDPNPEENLPFTLYSYASDTGGKSYSSYGLDGNWKKGLDPKSGAITIKDWQGGLFHVCLSQPLMSPDAASISFNTFNTNALPAPEPLYLIKEMNGEKTIQLCETFNSDYNYYLYLWSETALKGDISYTLTTENSLTPDPANCYGIPETLSDAGMGKNNTHKNFELIKGGKPFSIDFPYGGWMTVSVMYPNSLAIVNLEYNAGGPIYADKVYICGDVEKDDVKNGFMAPSEYNKEKYDQYFSLEKTGEGIFEGGFYVYDKGDTYSDFPDCLPQFRFFTELLGWTNTASLGSAEWDFYCLPVDLSNGPVELDIVEKGLGNWGPCIGEKWEGGHVWMTVDLNKPSVRLELVGSGVEEIETAETGVEKWFNLQGLPVEKPENGLYIHIINGKSRVELVK